MRKIRQNLILFSILLLSSCAEKQINTDFDGKWEFYDLVPGEPPKACLTEPDVYKLRELLIRCGAVKK